jgi:hypothetical protein
MKRYLKFNGSWLKVEQKGIMSDQASAGIAHDGTRAMIPLCESFTAIFQWIHQTCSRDDHVNFEVVL